jgi:RHS repeat-associated protein
LLNDQVKFATYTRDSATGNDYADQRYYSSTLGRFMTADPYTASGGPGSPTSWNRYAYTRGDPANSIDRTGLLNTAPLGDDDDDDGGGNSCVAADGFTPLPGPGCQTTGTPSPSIGTATPPACWQVTTKIDLTLTNIGNDILGIAAAKDKDITVADMIALNTTIATDISNEMQEEQSNPLAFYNGGHFFLNLDLISVANDFGGDNTAAYQDFLNLFDPKNFFGKRNGRRYPDPVPTTDPTHKYYLHDHDNNGTLDFHFDQYNPYSFFPVSTLQHFGIDVFYGGLGMPCLDPAWKH